MDLDVVRKLVVLVSLVLLATSCGSSSDSAGSSASSTSSVVERSPAEGDPEGQGAELRDILQSAGATILDRPEVVESASAELPLVLTAGQVEAMAAEIDADGGLTGGELDEYAALSDDRLPLSALIAAWAAEVDSPAAAAARDLMGDTEWTAFATTSWPGAVVALFAADLASARQWPSVGVSGIEPAGLTVAVPTGTVPGSVQPDPTSATTLPPIRKASFAAPIAAAQSDDATACGVLAGFLQSSLAFLVRGINAAAEKLGFLAKVAVAIFGFILSIAADVIGAIIDEALAPIRVAVGAVTFITLIASIIEPWRITAAVEPAGTLPLDIEGEGATTVRVTMSVAGAAGFQWPPDVVSCARLVGLDLPSPSTGSPVGWRLIPLPGQVASNLRPIDDVLANGRAEAVFDLGSESAETAKGAAQPGMIRVTADVRREDLAKVAGMVVDLVRKELGGLPGFVRKVVDDFVVSIGSAGLAKLRNMAVVRGVADVAVIYHTPPTTTTTSVPDQRPGSGGTNVDREFCRVWGHHLAITRSGPSIDGLQASYDVVEAAAWPPAIAPSLDTLLHSQQGAAEATEDLRVIATWAVAHCTVADFEGLDPQFYLDALG